MMKMEEELLKVTLKERKESITYVMADEERYEFIGMADNFEEENELLKGAVYGGQLNANAVQKNLEDYCYEFHPNQVKQMSVSKGMMNDHLFWFYQAITPQGTPFFQVLLFGKKLID